MISVIVPALDESATIATCLASLVAEPEVAEVLVSDGGSQDDTIAIAAAHPKTRVVRAPRGRARQMNAAARQACGELLWFVHADSRFGPGAGAAIEQAMSNPDVAIGALRFAVDAAGLRFRCVEWLTRWRVRLRRTPYGDQGLFVRAADFTRWGGFPEQPILEDLHFLRIAKRHGRVSVIPIDLHTSPRRWERHGVLRVAWQHQQILWLDALGVSPERIAARRASR